MAEKKNSASGSKKNKSPILESLSFLFYISKVLGIIPYSISNYVTKKQFKVSQLGNVFCVLSCIHYTTHYHLLTASTLLSEDSNISIGTLTTVLGIFIIYMEPLMMVIDVLAALINQKSFITIFDRLREIDDKLGKENVLLNYRVITKYSITFLAIGLLGEVTLRLFNLITFQTDLISWSSLWWFMSCIPLFANSVAKTWFLVLILLVQQRLQAINDYLNDTKKIFVEKKTRPINRPRSHLKKDNLFIENIGYLEKEIFVTRNMKIKGDNSWNWVGNSVMTNKVNDINIFTPRPKGILNVVPYDPNRKGEIFLNLIDCLETCLHFTAEANRKSIMMDSLQANDHDFLIGDKMDKKLINLCRAHDEICEIAKQVNRMFSFQMLITMAYGFMSITAQFYFLYCGLMEQVLLSLTCVLRLIRLIN